MDNSALNMAMMTSGIYGPNPYLTNQGRIPATTYRGTPTDAYGRPIQPPPGITLNSTPAAPQQQAAPQQPDMMAMRNAALTGEPGAALAYGANFAPAGSPPGIQQMYGQNFAAFKPTRNWGQAAAPAAPTAPPDTSYQNALDLLSNPGRVETPGATVPQSKPLSDQPSVLDQFLAGQHGGQGAGNYSNQSFFDVLNRLRGNASQTQGGGAPQLQSQSSGVPFRNYGDMGGAQMNAGMPTPPPGTPGAPKDIMTRGFLDANGVPNGPLMADARQRFGAAQGRLT